MSAKPIWAAEAATGGQPWRLADELWQRWMVAAREAFRGGQAARAGALWRAAGDMAASFSRGDPRTAASLDALANACGRESGRRELLLRALEAWALAGAWVEAMAVTERARSSLFHQRLATRHAGAWPDILRRRQRRTLAAGRAATAARLASLTGESAAVREALALRRDAFGERESGAAAMAAWLGEPVAGPIGDRFLERPPTGRDDEARLLAAALLAPACPFAPPAPRRKP